MLTITQATPAQVSYESIMDWSEARILTTARVDLLQVGGPPIGVRTAATDMAASHLPDHMLEVLAPIPLNSSVLVGELLSIPVIRSQFLESAPRPPTQSFTNGELSVLTLRYEHSIFPDFARSFMLHTKAYVHEPLLGFSSTTRYSGIVIYAKGEFPVHGEPGRFASLAPALLPRIYGESMSLLYESGMVEPSTALSFGIVDYSESTRLTEHRSRIGDVPFVTMAREVFGVNRTDLVITDAAVARILGSDENRRLLAEGRVVIICDLQ